MSWYLLVSKISPLITRRSQDYCGLALGYLLKLTAVAVPTFSLNDNNEKYRESDRNSYQNEKVSLDIYREKSSEIMSIIEGFSPIMERASIDEAYLDITALVNIRLKEMEVKLNCDNEPVFSWENCGIIIGDQKEGVGWRNHQLKVGAILCKEIRDTIYNTLGYTCSGGISTNKSLAKLCSSLNKPNNQTVIPDDEILNFIKEVPIEKIRFFGGSLGNRVRQDLNVEKAGDLWKYDEKYLSSKYGTRSARIIYNSVRGTHNEKVNVAKDTKIFNCIKNFKPPISSESDKINWINLLSSELYNRVIKEYQKGNRWPSVLGIVLFMNKNHQKSKAAQFPVYTKYFTLELCSQSARQLLESLYIELGTPIFRMTLFATRFFNKYGKETDIYNWIQSKKSDPTPQKNTKTLEPPENDSFKTASKIHPFFGRFVQTQPKKPESKVRHTNSGKNLQEKLTAFAAFKKCESQKSDLNKQ